jgi:hypothetical protein
LPHFNETAASIFIDVGGLAGCRLLSAWLLKINILFKPFQKGLKAVFLKELKEVMPVKTADLLKES